MCYSRHFAEVSGQLFCHGNYCNDIGHALEVIMKVENGYDITRGIKTIEILKSEMLSEISVLFSSLLECPDQEIRDTYKETLSNIVLISYILARRLGLDYDIIDNEIQKKVKLSIINGNEIEKYYGDLSRLARYRSEPK